MPISKIHASLREDERVEQVQDMRCNDQGVVVLLRPGYVVPSGDHVVAGRSFTHCDKLMSSVAACKCKYCSPPEVHPMLAAFDKAFIK
jgi:hypothetical protein